MKQPNLRSLTFFAFLVAALLSSVKPAHACWIGGSDGGYPSCMVVGAGSQICATTDYPPYCQANWNDCCNDGGGGCGCIPCGGGCCASLKSDKQTSCATIKKMAWVQESTTEPDANKPNHLKEFLAMADRGEFDGKTIYMDDSGPIAKGILNLPLDHWKSFTQQVVMKGWKKDPRLDLRVQHDGTPQILLQVETKTGHKFTIHLVTDSAIKGAINQPQSKSQQPNLNDKL